MLDLRSSFFTQAYEKPIVGISNLPAKIIDRHLSQSDGSPVSEGDSLPRTELSFSIVQNGRFLSYLGSDNRLFPMERLRMEDLRFPPIFIYHGRNDSAVPYEGSIAFVEQLRQLQPGGLVQLEIKDGDHGFMDSVGLAQVPWLLEGLNKVTRYWTRSKLV